MEGRTFQCLLLSVIYMRIHIVSMTDRAACVHSNNSVDGSSAEGACPHGKRDSILLPGNKAHLSPIDCVCVVVLP